MNNQEHNFSVVRRVKSFSHAVRGVKIFFTSTHNSWIQIGVFAVVIFAGRYFHISHSEWLALVLAGGLVITAESLNTAIEIHMNFTSSEPHPYARDTKDVAAGAVLISSVTAFAVGLIIFAPYLW